MISLYYDGILWITMIEQKHCKAHQFRLFPTGVFDMTQLLLVTTSPVHGISINPPIISIQVHIKRSGWTLSQVLVNHFFGI